MGTGAAIGIAGELCEIGFEQAIREASAAGRLEFAARLTKLRGAVRKAGVEDVDREIAEIAESLQRIEQSASTGKVLFALELPIYTKCEANARAHHMAKHRMLGDLRPTVEMAIRANANKAHFKPTFPCVVRMTRLAPKANRLDSGDNLSSALKRARDGIADWLRVDDRHERLVSYVCEQEDAHSFGVRIEIIAGGNGS